MITLALDASTYNGTVAVWRHGEVIAEGAAAMRGADHERLLPEVAAALERGGVRAQEVDRVICGAGPGSFTSLRIAASIAKGLFSGIGARRTAAFAVVPSLGLVVAGSDAGRKEGRYLAVMDALRGEVYVALYDVAADGAVREIAPARIVAEGEVNALATSSRATAIGPRCSIHGEPHARGALALLTGAAGETNADWESWEPVYGRLAEAQVKWEAAHGRPLPRE